MYARLQRLRHCIQTLTKGNFHARVRAVPELLHLVLAARQPRTVPVQDVVATWFPQLGRDHHGTDWLAVEADLLRCDLAMAASRLAEEGDQAEEFPDVVESRER